MKDIPTTTIDVNKEKVIQFNKYEITGVNKHPMIMAGRKRKDQNAPIVEQCVRLSTETMIQDFLKDPEKTELSFPPDFDNTQRRYVHEYVKKFGLKSKSHGKSMCTLKVFIPAYKSILI